MKLFKLREKLHKQGLVLLPHGDQWLVTDEGTKHPFEKLFDTLDAVDAWVNLKNNRLTDEEADEFDEQFKKFCN